jgi:hypothetical protein
MLAIFSPCSFMRRRVPTLTGGRAESRSCSCVYMAAASKEAARMTERPANINAGIYYSKLLSGLK